MATTVHEPPKIKPRARKGGTGSGGGGWRDRTPRGGSVLALGDRSPAASKTGVWVGIAAITMSFAALTSALVVRQGSATDWQHFTFPSILYVNSLVLLASSFTLEFARRRFTRFAVLGPEEQATGSLRWLYATLALGLLFVGGQYVAWVQLRSQGLYLATNPSSSFFYVLTAVHAMHVLGGLGGLLYVSSKLRRSVLGKNTLDAASHYWHFMDILWLYLFLLLWMKV
jgi:cytochrome c oxidase subunit III